MKSVIIQAGILTKRELRRSRTGQRGALCSLFHLSRAITILTMVVGGGLLAARKTRQTRSSLPRVSPQTLLGHVDGGSIAGKIAVEEERRAPAPGARATKKWVCCR